VQLIMEYRLHLIGTIFTGRRCIQLLTEIYLQESEGWRNKNPMFTNNSLGQNRRITQKADAIDAFSMTGDGATRRPIRTSRLIESL